MVHGPRQVQKLFAGAGLPMLLNTAGSSYPGSRDHGIPNAGLSRDNAWGVELLHESGIEHPGTL